MANQEHVDLLKQGVAQWNTWREQHPKTPDLGGARLSGVNLSGINLSDAILIGADLNGAILIDADLNSAILVDADLSDADLTVASLSSANLKGANLSGARLSDATLEGATLEGANLYNANLEGVNLQDANLSNANLRGAIMWATIFAHTNLHEVVGLTEIDHQGPSCVELYTIQLPQDDSALHFLRGAGVPDEWLTFYQSTMMHPIQYHSCFISYSNKDETLARRLHADLQARGVRCWFAQQDMKIGDEIRSRIYEAIHLQDKLLLLLSEHSLASTWVKNEVEAAFEKEEKEHRLVLFPVRLDECVEKATQAWAATLRRTRHIGDFTAWTDSQVYQQAFERLLRDLKAERES